MLLTKYIYKLLSTIVLQSITINQKFQIISRLKIRESIFPRQKHIAATKSNLEQIVSPSFKTISIMPPTTKTIERRKIAVGQ